MGEKAAPARDSVLTDQGAHGENPLSSFAVQVESLFENLCALRWVRLATMTNKPKIPNGSNQVKMFCFFCFLTHGKI